MLNFGEIFLLFLLNLRPSHREGPAVNSLSSLYITITIDTSMYSSNSWRDINILVVREDPGWL